MMNTTQSRFAEALLDRTRPVPADVTSWTGSAPVKRYGVYRNNVATGLARALAARFPVTEKIVGEEFFTAMARDFVLAHPPTSPVLLHYGADFAGFVADFVPAASLPYLPDIVRLEDAQTRAYHARDTAPISPDVLTRVTSERMSGLTFHFHPAVRLVRSAFPIVTIWSMNAGLLPLAPIKDWRAEDALVTRPELSVITRQVSPGSAIFLLALMRHATLGEAFDEALQADAEFDLGRNLAELMRSGALIDIVAEPSLEA
ncbi:DNA-binding domain-containing protein [Aestuariivirga sp. YIM B02566]|uniref:DNA-binding domain-containing protein n=1 Tax=Taklimakanibacter albus TaxID=2800327 RepID=A0ACC5QZ14_9HYPH|nr:DNA-binding domain-containing protein [Aestuariivirga sp. YIM B02566]MBK1865647.1 putative DNA-binding domain-containing protein [Aestuariivirga sp. YIM B02566]